MPRQLLAYWRPDTADRELARDQPLNHAASEQFERASVGDTLWIVTVRSGELFLLGKLIIGTLTDAAGAQAILGTTDLWEADHHVIAEAGTAVIPREVSLTAVASRIRFESATSSHLTVADGRVNAQELQTMRVLTPESATLLQEQLSQSSSKIIKTGGLSLVQGQVYRRRDLHVHFGGQTQGGISTPANTNVILLFTGESGEQHGYADGWSDDGVFLYTGEGQTGDMEFVRGNVAIRDHAQNGRDLHLFKQTKKGFVRYEGQMVSTGFHFQHAPDTHGSPRQAIVFELVPLTEFAEVEAPPVQAAIEQSLQQASLGQLREKALAASASAKSPAERKALTRYRSQAIKVYVLKRSKGICEGCSSPAPFRTPDGSPYLEPHHVRRLSDGGPDHPRWVVAVCANCHRRAHYAEDAAAYNKHLTEIIGHLEPAE